MQRMTLTLQTVTPCFLGGAQQDGTDAEWRSASVRGQLRWWFRALAGAKTNGDIKPVRELEEAIFGSTSRQSALSVGAEGSPRSTDDSRDFDLVKSAKELAAAWGDTSEATKKRLLLLNRNHPEQHIEVKSKPLHYLCYGPSDKGKLKRKYLEVDQPLTLSLRLRTRFLPPGTEGAVELLGRALWAWIHLGGIGSRSRRGYGSLRVTADDGQLAGWPGVPESIEELGKQLGVVIGDVTAHPPAEPLPSWTYLTSGATIVRSATALGSWHEALALAGGWLMAFRRRYGINGDKRSHGSVSDRDYAWAKGKVSPAQVPDRAGFGLPLAFGKDPQVQFADGKEPRRASPLLIHVARFGNQFWPLFTHLPAELVPRGETLRLAKAGSAITSPPTPQQNNVIHHFLADLSSTDKGRLITRIWP